MSKFLLFFTDRSSISVFFGYGGGGEYSPGERQSSPYISDKGLPAGSSARPKGEASH